MATHQGAAGTQLLNTFQGVAQAVAHQTAAADVQDGDVVARRLNADDVLRTDDQLYVAFVVHKAHHAFLFAFLAVPQAQDGALRFGDAQVTVDAFRQQPIEGVGIDGYGDVNQQYPRQVREVAEVQVEREKEVGEEGRGDHFDQLPQQVFPLADAGRAGGEQ